MDVHGDDESLSDPDADLLDRGRQLPRRAARTKNLKYGAAYAPNLETILDYAYDETQTVMVTDVNGRRGAATASCDRSTPLATTSCYERAKAAIRDLPLKLPPSGAMAGVYAEVDAERGVWKAPANVAAERRDQADDRVLQRRATTA